MARRSALRHAVAGGLDRLLQVPNGMRPLAERASGRTASAATTSVRTRIGLAVAGSLITLVACSGEESASQASPSTEAPETRPSPATPSAAEDPESEAAEEAMAVYGDLTQLIQDARRDPTQNWVPAYTQLTADPYRSAELLEISALRDRGIAHTGSVTNNPEVVGVDLAGGTDGTLQTVTIEDCVDTRDFPAAVQTTGEVISAERPPHLAVATVVFYRAPTERWLVTAVDVQDQTC